MKKKKILKGISILALIFGLVMVLTLASCEEQKTEIVVSNSSSHPNDSVVTAAVYMRGRGDAVASQNVNQGESVSFSVESGEYRVIVRGFSYPQDGSFINMSGTVRLRFSGNSVTRTN